MGNIVGGVIWFVLGGILHLAREAILLLVLGLRLPTYAFWFVSVVVTCGGIIMMLIGFFFIMHWVVEKAVKSALVASATEAEKKKWDDYWEKRRQGTDLNFVSPSPAEGQPPATPTGNGTPTKK